ncbi:MAG TPA: hypothetical protein VK815_15570 [Candidatus Acidoferrales bacterium]|jgi:hypothetical protein|nr:hypothetical protein [Candidatus Acidoferrales bacterium]
MIKWVKKLIGEKTEVGPTTQEKFRQLWKTLVPLSGEAETLQGEIIRAVGKLEDEYNRNGNVNWEPGDYHGELVKFLKYYLADAKTFDAGTVKQIKDAAEQVRLAAEDLQTETIEGEEVQSQKHSADSAFKFLIDRAVEWCDRNSVPIYKPDGQDYWITPE